jgi:hypothetical protein
VPTPPPRESDEQGSPAAVLPAARGRGEGLAGVTDVVCHFTASNKTPEVR